MGEEGQARQKKHQRQGGWVGTWCLGRGLSMVKFRNEKQQETGGVDREELWGACLGGLATDVIVIMDYSVGFLSNIWLTNFRITDLNLIFSVSS